MLIIGRLSGLFKLHVLQVLKPNLHLRSSQRMAVPLSALCNALGSAGLARGYAKIVFDLAYVMTYAFGFGGTL